MKKIPTLFRREFKNHEITKIYPEVTEGFEWVLNGEGIATVKYDGSCCAWLDYGFYKRYDAKWGKKIPEGAIPCQEEADAVTGHFPCWVKCDEDDPSNKWFIKALEHYSWGIDDVPKNQTYEAVGLHFQGNPYGLDYDYLIPHGKDVVNVKRDFYSIRDYLRTHYIEGLVFWKDGVPQCKIKRSDFGIPWACKEVKGTITLVPTIEIREGDVLID